MVGTAAWARQRDAHVVRGCEASGGGGITARCAAGEIGEVESARVLQLVRLALLFSPKPHSSPTIPTLRRTTTFLTYSGRRSQDLKDFTRRSLDRLAAAAGN